MVLETPSVVGTTTECTLLGVYISVCLCVGGQICFHTAQDALTKLYRCVVKIKIKLYQDASFSQLLPKSETQYHKCRRQMDRHT